MEVEIDRFGRVLIPKAVRDSAGIEAGSKLEITEEHGRIVLEIAEPFVAMDRNPDGLIVLHGELVGHENAVQEAREERMKMIRGGQP